MSAPGTHSRRFVDRGGITYGHFTALACVGRARSRQAVWSCRCDCGRPGCVEMVERTSANLRKGERPDCRRGPRVAGPPALRPVPAMTPPPEGLRSPWSRSADERADRDARLLAAFELEAAHGKADLR